jgi:hypothetical protein
LGVDDVASLMTHIETDPIVARKTPRALSLAASLSDAAQFHLRRIQDAPVSASNPPDSNRVASGNDLVRRAELAPGPLRASRADLRPAVLSTASTSPARTWAAAIYSVVI